MANKGLGQRLLNVHVIEIIRDRMVCGPVVGFHGIRLMTTPLLLRIHMASSPIPPLKYFDK